MTAVGDDDAAASRRKCRQIRLQFVNPDFLERWRWPDRRSPQGSGPRRVRAATAPSRRAIAATVVLAWRANRRSSCHPLLGEPASAGHLNLRLSLSWSGRCGGHSRVASAADDPRSPQSVVRAYRCAFSCRHGSSPAIAATACARRRECRATPGGVSSAPPAHERLWRGARATLIPGAPRGQRTAFVPGAFSSMEMVTTASLMSPR